MSFEFFSLGMYTLSTIFRWLLIWKFFHVHFRLACSHLRTLGHFLYKERYSIWARCGFISTYADYMSYFFMYGWFHVEPHFRDAWPNHYVPEGYVNWDQSMYLLNVSLELFFSLEQAWFQLIKYVPHIFVWFLEKCSCSFLRFTHLFLRFSALLRALDFSCQILSRPSFSSSLTK